MTSASLWVQGARPRTLGAAVAPVLVGTAAAVADADGVIWWRFGCALLVALALQVGVNYANDYSDGVRGTDKQRKGPLRLTATGTATPQAVKGAAALSFLVAAVAGLVLSTAAMALLVFTIIEAPDYGWSSARSLAGFAVSAVLLVAFVWCEQRTSHPPGGRKVNRRPPPRRHYDDY